MSRLRKLPVEEWSTDLRELARPESATELERGLMRFFAHAPEMAKSVAALGGGLKVHRSLPNRLVELVRLRVAFHNQCRSCMAIRYQDAVADGVSEALVCELEAPRSSNYLTDAEKAALDYADAFATNHYSIGDDTYRGLEQYFSESEIIELGVTVAFFVGFGRLAATFDMIEELPERFQDKSIERISPWKEDHVVVR